MLRLEATDRYLRAVAAGKENEARNQEQALVFIDHLLQLESQTRRIAAQESMNHSTRRVG
jgi:hypothetical protein